MFNLFGAVKGGSKLCIFLALLLLSGCKTDLYSKLSETEANEIISVLTANGIASNRTTAKDGTTTVQVEETSFGEAVAILNDAGLPRQKFASMGDVFADTKLVSSPTEERARFIFAVSQELSKTLSEIEGVFAARVHIVLPRNDPLQTDEKPSSASVFIKHDPEVSMAPLLPQIKTLVTNGIEGLTYDKVSVVFVAADKKRTAAALAKANSAAAAVNSWASFQDTSFILIAFAILGWVAAAVCAGALWFSRAQLHGSTSSRSFPGLAQLTSLTKSSSK